MGFFSKFFSKEKKETLDKGLERTKQGVFAKIAHAIAGKSKIDDEVLDNLEEVFENREQIEISRYYEQLPKPTLRAAKEFEDGEVYWRNPTTTTM